MVQMCCSEAMLQGHHGQGTPGMGMRPPAPLSSLAPGAEHPPGPEQHNGAPISGCSCHINNKKAAQGSPGMGCCSAGDKQRVPGSRTGSLAPCSSTGTGSLCPQPCRWEAGQAGTSLIHFTFVLFCPSALIVSFIQEEIGWGNLEVKNCKKRQFFKLCQFLLLNQLDIVPLNKSSCILSEMVERYHEFSLPLPYGVKLPPRTAGHSFGWHWALWLLIP